MAAQRVVIIGGGFAAAACARTLRRSLCRTSVEIVLFSLENHLVFTPLLADVVGASINPLDAIVPLRQMLPGVRCRTEEVVDVDRARREVVVRGEEGRRERVAYDHVVLACGSIANLHVVPGMADHAFPLKNIADAITLRSHVMEQMERAETAEDIDQRRRHLSFVVVGGGYSGVEAAGEINDLVRGSARHFQSFTAEDVSVTLIQGRDQILLEIGESLREIARRRMEKAGVRIVLGARVASVTVEGVLLKDGSLVRGGTVVCTVGSSPSPIVERLDAPKLDGRVLTEADLRVRGEEHVWAIGDCASITNLRDGRPSPPTGQFAERQGRACAQNIARALRGEPGHAFSHKPLGQLCSIGGRRAVAEILGVRVSGFVAWFLWRTIYLFKLPTWARRIQVGFDWMWLVFFPRDLAHVRTRPTERVARAHFLAGDTVVRQGDVPAGLYVVARGEVELVRDAGDGEPSEVIGLLGPSSFFGESAMLGGGPIAFSVRARTAAEVVLMGREVFTQVSAGLAPLRDAVAAALSRRSTDLWDLNPEAYAVLGDLRVRDLMEPAPRPLLASTIDLQTAARAFVEGERELLYLSSDGRRLDGVLTLKDWLRAASTGGRPHSPASEFMTAEPVTLGPDDRGALAANVLREHRLESLPVVTTDGREIVGCLRVRHLMAHVLRTLGPRLQALPGGTPDPSSSLSSSSSRSASSPPPSASSSAAPLPEASYPTAGTPSASDSLPSQRSSHAAANERPLSF